MSNYEVEITTGGETRTFPLQIDEESLRAHAAKFLPSVRDNWQYHLDGVLSDWMDENIDATLRKVN